MGGIEPNFTSLFRVERSAGFTASLQWGSGKIFIKKKGNLWRARFHRDETTEKKVEHSFCAEFSGLFENAIYLGLTLLQTPEISL